MARLKNWMKERFSAGDTTPPPPAPQASAPQKSPATPSGAKVPRPDPEFVDLDPSLHGRIESEGPVNVLIQNPYVREETGTHETLKILDDSLVDTGEEAGIDPYNTGGFDRSKKWDQRFRK